MTYIFQKIKQNKVSVLAVLLVAAVLFAFLPFGTGTVNAQEITLANVIDNVGTQEGTTLKIFGNDVDIEKLYTYTNGVWTSDDGKDYIAKVDDIEELQGKTLQAVSPATASTTEFTIPTDQSTAEKLISADWCVSDSISITENMNFTLNHLLSKVTVVIYGVGDGYEMPTFDNSNYIRFNSYVSVTYDGTLGTTDTEKTAITPYGSTTTESKQTFTAMVYPVANGEQLLEMFLNYGDTDEANNVVLESASNIDMEAGKHYTFNLTIKTNEIELTLASVDPFTEGWSDEVNLDGTTETIGNADNGKTGWANGDKITLTVNGGGINGQTETITYNDGWTAPDFFKYLTNNGITVSALYTEGNAGLFENMQASAEVENGKVTINFPEKRPYSRLRIPGEADETEYKVTFTNFTPAGASEAVETYEVTLKPDTNQNMFLYGTWGADSKVTVMNSDGVEIRSHTFTAANDNGKSYVLNGIVVIEPTINGTSVTLDIPAAARENKVKSVIDELMKVEPLYSSITVTGASDTVKAYLDQQIKSVYGKTGAETFVITKVNGVTTHYVTTADELTAWNSSMAKNKTFGCVLLKDITLTGESNWTPNVFAGIFDGNNKSITGLHIKSPNKNVGFIAEMDADGVVKDLNLKNVYVTSTCTRRVTLVAGGIVGSNEGTIVHCSVSGEIVANHSNGYVHAGGIAGSSVSDSSIIACYNEAKITAVAATESGYSGYASGISNVNANLSIVGCYNIGTVEGSTYGGGISAVNGGEIKACYSIGATAGNRTAGAVVGDNSGSVNNCYYTLPTDTSGLTYTPATGDDNATQVDGATVKWADAMTAMNNAIAEYNATATADKQCNYHYEVNTGSDAATRPLILVAGAPTAQ